MTRDERWLTSAAFIAGTTPLIFMALILKLLPAEVPLMHLSLTEASPEYASKYNNLITGLFCVVPLSIVVIAKYIKRHIPDYRNYKAILIVAIALSLSFLGIVIFGLIVQLRRVEAIRDFDYTGFSSVLLSIAIAMCGNITRYRKMDGRLAINNRFTRASLSVWKTVHSNAATVQILWFAFIAVSLSFIRGWITFVVLAGGISAFLIWTYVHSYFVRNAFERKRREHAVGGG
jgi:hypothetical protein